MLVLKISVYILKSCSTAGRFETPSLQQRHHTQWPSFQRFLPIGLIHNLMSPKNNSNGHVKIIPLKVHGHPTIQMVKCYNYSITWSKI